MSDDVILLDVADGIATVTLNPERTEVVTAAVARGNSRPLAA